MTDLEAPWTVGYPALEEHDSVRVFKVYHPDLGADVDVVAGAEDILAHPPLTRWQKIAHNAGLIAMGALMAGASALELYEVINTFNFPFNK